MTSRAELEQIALELFIRHGFTETTLDDIAAAAGTTRQELERAEALFDAGVDIMVVDTAHGHSVRVLESVSRVKKLSNAVQVIAGNVATREGARALIEELKERGYEVVLASSAVEKHVDAFLDKLDARDLADSWTTKDDVEASKPDPDLVQAALAKADTRDAVMVGDTPWDVEAARRAGIETVCVMTGGFSDQELRDAGAASVFGSVVELLERLDETPLA